MKQETESILIAGFVSAVLGGLSSLAYVVAIQAQKIDDLSDRLAVMESRFEDAQVKSKAD